MLEQNTMDLFKVSEIELVYHSGPDGANRPIITDADICCKVFRENWDANKIELQEQFKVMLLNARAACLGIVEIGKGGITKCLVDNRLIFAAALKANAVSIILAHNHPSGSLEASAADKILTRNLIEAGKLLQIDVLDHIILTANSYTSLSDNGLIP